MRRHESDGTTRSDILVVLVLSVFLLALAGSSASNPDEQARRTLCRANLSKIGKAMLVYAADYDGVLPRAGGRNCVWGLLGVNWSAMNRYTAYGTDATTNEGGRASISSCLYLLVKFMELPTKRFICPSDRKTIPFELAEEGIHASSFQLIDAWDFGSDPSNNCSYAYHIPFGIYFLTTSRDPNLPVAADRSPWIKSPASEVDTSAYAIIQPCRAMLSNFIVYKVY